MNRITKTLIVEPPLFDQIEAMLLSGKLVDDHGREDEIFGWSVHFDDGKEMDIKVVNALSQDGGPWCEGVLFGDGSEIGCTEVGEQLAGEYIVQDTESQTEYCVVVERATENLVKEQ